MLDGASCGGYGMQRAVTHQAEGEVPSRTRLRIPSGGVQEGEARGQHG
jgi:phage-related minor tail protein